jgi:hypothetical protein
MMVVEEDERLATLAEVLFVRHSHATYVAIQRTQTC